MRFELNSSIKSYERYKVCHPQQTIERIINGFEKLDLKIINKNRNEKGVYTSTAWLENDFLVTAGKGSSLILSQASAYAELAERFSGGWIREYYINLLKYQEEKYKHGHLCSYANLREEKISLDYFFDGFKKNFRDDNNIVELVRNFPLFWQPAHSLIKNKTVNVPYFWNRAIQGTNGIAAGNSMEEAVMHAIGEVVERYVASKIIQNRYSLPTITSDSATNKYLIKIMNFFRNENIEFIIKDCSLGFPLSSIGVLFTDKNCVNKNEFVKTRNNNFVVGTSTDPEIAAIRCFTEYAQAFWKGYETAETYWKMWDTLDLEYKPDTRKKIFFQLHSIKLYDESFLKTKSKIISFSDIPNRFDIDYFVEINRCLESFSKMGYDILCIDLTHPVVNFPVVQIMIPELQINNMEPEIVNIFSKLAENNKIIEHNAQSYEIIQNYIGYKPTKSIEGFLLSEKWYDNIVGIKKVINMIEKRLIIEPMEYANLMDVSVYEILAYLYVSLGDYRKANRYSKLIPVLCVFNPNQSKKVEMLMNYARIQKFLGTKSFKKDPKSIGIIKIMRSTGISTEIEPRWRNIGNVDATNPFELCDFNCQKCSNDKNKCIWKMIPIEDFI